MSTKGTAVASDSDSRVREGNVEIDGLRVGYLELGSGPLALCLHGFPDTAHTWRHLMPELADAGFRVVAPYSRGYAPTTIPANEIYQTGALAQDALALHEALGGDGDAVIIGHDWGAMATYGAASHEPERWRKLVTLAVPPSPALAEAFLSYDQLRRSSYMFFFLHPLSNIVVPMDDFAFITGLWRDWSPGYDATEDVRHVAEALNSPERVAAALAYYRATWGGGAFTDGALGDLQEATSQVPSQPLLYLHGDQDGCMGSEVAAKVPG
ncbi:MAG: alpha/beta hydrolase, partial [Acidimicrobiales bacterium]